MKALIDPRETKIQYVSSWKKVTTIIDDVTMINWVPEMGVYENSIRVCQVESNSKIFPVAEPLYWIECPNDTIADRWYYDTVNQTFNPIVDALIPN